MKHPVNVLDDRRTRMESIFDFFIMVTKDFL